jgi:hypothetical protein
MTQKIHSFIFFFFIIISANAQVPRGFSVGIGMNQTMLDSDDLLSDPNLSYSAGLGFNFGYHESFNYETNFLVSNNTLKLDYVDDQALTVQQANYSIQNLDFSFQVNYYIITPDEDKFYFGPSAGGFVSISNGQLSPKDNAENQYYLPYRLIENSFSDISQFNYGASVGLTGGYNKFRLSLKYNHGLSNFLNGVQTDSYSESNLYTGPSLEGKLHSVSLILYYKFF